MMNSLFDSINQIVQGAISRDWSGMSYGIVNTVRDGVSLIFPLNWFR